MKKILILAIGLLICCQAICCQVVLAAPQATQFTFKFYPNQPLNYNCKINMKAEMNLEVAGQKIPMKTDMIMSLNIRLLPEADAIGKYTVVKMETSNIQVDYDIKAGGSHIIMKLRGSEVYATQDGQVFIDTQRNIGLADAQSIKDEVAAIYLSGKFEIDPQGRIGQILGDMPFVEFWSDINQYGGLLGITFPEKEIAVGDQWQESFKMTKMAEVLLKEPGLESVVTFTRKPDVIVGGKDLSVFSISAPIHQKNLAGYLDQAGQRIELRIPSITRTATGTVHFDKDRMVDYAVQVDGKAVMNFTAEGQDVRGEVKLNMKAEMKLL